MTFIIKLRKRGENLALSRQNAIRTYFQCHVINRIVHSCSCVIEFIKTSCEKEKNGSASLAFYLFSPTRVINSTKYEHPYHVRSSIYP